MSGNHEIALTESLEPLRQQFERDGDVISVWKAIEVVSRHNNRSARGNLPLSPLPDWICEYLAKSADRIHRLWLGIEPSDDRSVEEIGFNQVGRLRKVPQSDGGGSERFRDERPSYIAQALGFMGDGWNAFQRHDRALYDAQLLRIYDDPDLKDEPNLRKIIQGSLIRVVEKQEYVAARSVRNRLSKARKRQHKPRE